MKTKAFLAVTLLAALFFAGCHYGAHDDYRDYGGSYYGGSSDSYREGYRDGRAAERRRMDRADRYSNRDYWRYR